MIGFTEDIARLGEDEEMHVSGQEDPQWPSADEDSSSGPSASSFEFPREDPDASGGPGEDAPEVVDEQTVKPTLEDSQSTSGESELPENSTDSTPEVAESKQAPAEVSGGTYSNEGGGRDIAEEVTSEREPSETGQVTLEDSEQSPTESTDSSSAEKRVENPSQQDSSETMSEEAASAEAAPQPATGEIEDQSKVTKTFEVSAEKDEAETETRDQQIASASTGAPSEHDALSEGKEAEERSVDDQRDEPTVSCAEDVSDNSADHNLSPSEEIEDPEQSAEESNSEEPQIEDSSTEGFAAEKVVTAKVEKGSAPVDGDVWAPSSSSALWPEFDSAEESESAAPSSETAGDESSAESLDQETKRLPVPSFSFFWDNSTEATRPQEIQRSASSKLEDATSSEDSLGGDSRESEWANAKAEPANTGELPANTEKSDRESELWDTRSWSVPAYFAQEDDSAEAWAGDDRPTMDHRLGTFDDAATAQFPAGLGEQTAFIPRPDLQDEQDPPTSFTPLYVRHLIETPSPQAIPPAQHAMPVRIEPAAAPDDEVSHDQQADSDSGTAESSDGQGAAINASSSGEQSEEVEQRTPDVSGKAVKTDQPKSTLDSPVKPKRRKRGLVLAAVVLLLLIAAGAALALPKVSNRLALPWAPNAPRSEPPSPVAVTRALRAPDASAATPSKSGVSSVLSGPSHNSVLGTLTGSVIDPVTGAQLWNQNAGQPLTPASTTKLLTVSAALLAIDHGKQLSTKVVAGADPGTVILVGGGDPTLSSLPEGKESIYPGAAHLDDLVAQVKAASGGRITKVQLDLSAYTGPRTAPGWAPEDAPSTYAAPVTAAMLDGGRTSAVDEKSMRNGDPSAVLAAEFAKRLGNATVQSGTVKAPNDAKVLGEVRSAPLTELVGSLLLSSDDLLADAIMRQTAIAVGEEPSFAGGARATLKVLSENGFDVNQVKLSDGSGLSTLNKVPAGVLTDLMSVAAAPDGKDPKTAKLRPMLEGLPVAGGSGTLSTRYLDSSSAPGKGWVRAKTGSLSGVNTLAGLVLDQDGRVLVFALMSSSPSPADDVRKALDTITASLRGCGCR